MSKTGLTGFLDLPFELREMIYGYILPTDRVMNFPGSHQRSEEEKAVIAACYSHPAINKELEKMIFKECSACITLTPHKEMRLPPATEWNRFRSITIKIGHYEDHSRRYRWAGMRELITRLRYGKPETLPDTTILFHQVDQSRDVTRAYYGNAMWTEDIQTRSTFCWSGSTDPDYCRTSGIYRRIRESWEIIRMAREERHEGSDGELSDDDDDAVSIYRHVSPSHEYPDTWLRSTGDVYGNPIAIEILDYFLELPFCKSATVYPLHGMSRGDLNRPCHDPEARIFDDLYIKTLCAALELWLKGDRYGVELPVGLSKYGEPRLEQVAYQEPGGRLYCQDGLSQKKWKC